MNRFAIVARARDDRRIQRHVVQKKQDQPARTLLRGWRDGVEPLDRHTEAADPDFELFALQIGDRSAVVIERGGVDLQQLRRSGCTGRILRACGRTRGRDATHQHEDADALVHIEDCSAVRRP